MCTDPVQEKTPRRSFEVATFSWTADLSERTCFEVFMSLCICSFEAASMFLVFAFQNDESVELFQGQTANGHVDCDGARRALDSKEVAICHLMVTLFAKAVARLALKYLLFHVFEAHRAGNV
jgi:hypothetical protein